MPETRTYDPAEGNPLAQALRAALGEPVRPATPGAKAAPTAKTAPAPSATSWVSLSFTPSPGPAAEPEDED